MTRLQGQSNVTKKSDIKESFLAEQKKASSINKTIETSYIHSILPIPYDEESLTDQKKHHLKRGKKIIDELENLRLQLITGHVKEETLHSLICTLNNVDRSQLSGELNTLIDEIETRAVVELAKYGKDL